MAYEQNACSCDALSHNFCTHFFSTTRLKNKAIKMGEGGDLYFAATLLKQNKTKNKTKKNNNNNNNTLLEYLASTDKAKCPI